MAQGDFGGKRNTNGFDKNPDNIWKGGRPKKLMTKFKEMGYVKSEVQDTFSVIAALTAEELTALLDNQSSTILEIITAKSMLKGIETGEYKYVKEIIEVFAGKPDNKDFKSASEPPAKLIIQMIQDDEEE